MIGFVFDIILYKQVDEYFKEPRPSVPFVEINKIKYDWFTATKAKKTIKAAFFDFSSSFDTISHDLLIEKLEASGFSPEALSLIKSFLSYHEGSQGLPRGSFLARLLFTFFVKDLRDNLESSSAVICQNHVIVYATHEDHETLKQHMDYYIRKVWDLDKSYTLTYRGRMYTYKDQETVSSILELFDSLLDCNPFNLNWIQVLRETIKYKAIPWREICDKTKQKYKKHIGKKQCKTVSEKKLDDALMSLVLL